MSAIDPESMRLCIKAAAKIVERMPANSAKTFAAVTAELSKIRGISKAVALKTAMESLPGSYRAFCRAQEEHQAPELFPHREEYQKRRLRAIQTGRIN